MESLWIFQTLTLIIKMHKMHTPQPGHPTSLFLQYLVWFLDY